MKDLTPGDKKLLYDIDTTGWHVLKVLAGENGPGFVYSVGLYKTFKHPEIIIIGLNPDNAHILINNIGHDLKAGKKYESEKYYEDILDNFKCFSSEYPKSTIQSSLDTAVGIIIATTSRFCNAFTQQ